MMKKVILTVVLFAGFGFVVSAQTLVECPDNSRPISSCQGFSGCVSVTYPLTAFLDLDAEIASGPQKPTDSQMAEIQGILDDLLCD